MTSEEDYCSPAVVENDKLIVQLDYWIDGVAEGLLSGIGIVANVIAIVRLSNSKRASCRTVFNKIIVTLCVIDSIFLLCCLSEVWRRQVSLGGTNWHLIVFVSGLYQLQSIALTCSIFGTVSLATERYLAVTRPIEYHLNVNTSLDSPIRRALLRYTIPTVVFSIVFNLPRFFEFTYEYEPVEDQSAADNIVYQNVQNASEIEIAVADEERWRVFIRPTDLRLNEFYVYYYVNLARFTMTGILPFATLVYLNTCIHRALGGFSKSEGTCQTATTQTNEIARARQNSPSRSPCDGIEMQERASQRPGEVNSRAVVQAEAQRQGHSASSMEKVQRSQSVILVAIVLLFLVCNVPRIILNGYELMTVQSFKENVGNACYRLPIWVTVCTHISLILITFNSATTLFIYCCANPSFRRELMDPIRKAFSFRRQANGGGGATV